MKSFLIVLGVAVIGACLLSPPVYWLLMVVWPSSTWPFSRVFDRVILATLLLGIYIARRQLSLQGLGSLYRCPRAFAVRSLCIGALLAFGTSMALLPLLVGNGELSWKSITWEWLLPRIAKSIAAALVIAALEEFIFRALLCAKLLARFGPIIAAVSSSAVYAAVHFFKPDKAFIYEGLDLTAGFRYLALITQQALSFSLLPALAGLFLVGLVLCVALYKSGNIYLSMGLHIGWVLTLKLSFYLTDVAPGAVFADGIGRRYYLVAQPLAWLSFLLVFFFVLYFAPRLSKCAHK